MFDKILIANRGEIACRIIRTAKKMGIRTVAVYSEADADGLHARMADEAYLIGPAASAESYLRGDRILEAVAASGAQAIHPGFGFLSENAEFASQVRAAGVAFIGPPEGAISAMGDKIESKRLAARSGVSTIPGHTEALRDAEEALAVSVDIGFPVMLKASAGGGGKGMRVARSEQEVREGFASAANEAIASFGDDRIFVEKFIEQPRHIEIQVIADSQGNVVHLGERECSIQRRHQKVLEEAPSPFIDEPTRQAMGAQAVQLAKAVSYESAGTVEFVVDSARQFYFLEMNTRLQVEHPVTEYVTGLDLVELMIRVAAGEPLPFAQSDVSLEGWALEARVYAEDPTRGFLPSTGRVTRYSPPGGADYIRVDTGVDEGTDISMFYDPMIAKLVTAGETRAQALERMAAALDSYTIRGLAHNVAFLNAVVRHPRFQAGDMTTAFIDEEFSDGYVETQATHPDPALLVAVAAYCQARVDASERTDGPAEGFPKPYTVVTADEAREESSVEVGAAGAAATVSVGDRCISLESVWRPGEVLFAGKADGEPFALQLERLGQRWRLEQAGCAITVNVLSPRAAELNRLMPIKRPPDLSKFLLSPMPGLLVRVSVEPGQAVKAGQELAVVEAMKMENVLFASQDATVAAVLSSAGDSLTVDQAIIAFD